MYQYRVKFSFNGQQREVVVGANNENGARSLVQGQYPGAMIMQVTRVG